MEVDELDLVRAEEALDPTDPDHPALGIGPLDERAQLDRPIGDLEVTQRATHVV